MAGIIWHRFKDESHTTEKIELSNIIKMYCEFDDYGEEHQFIIVYQGDKKVFEYTSRSELLKDYDHILQQLIRLEIKERG